jgi:IS4 transposase
LSAFAAGKSHDFRVKTLEQVLWRKSGTRVAARVVVIAPLGYRRRKGSKLLYRAPAFLLCTDPELDLAKLVQYYLWRWGIEVNFREEKQLLGAGDAQVRTAQSNRGVPAMVVGAYSLLWLAALRM